MEYYINIWKSGGELHASEPVSTIDDAKDELVDREEDGDVSFVGLGKQVYTYVHTVCVDGTMTWTENLVSDAVNAAKEAQTYRTSVAFDHNSSRGVSHEKA